jgi:hypothetical protein
MLLRINKLRANFVLPKIAGLIYHMHDCFVDQVCPLCIAVADAQLLLHPKLYSFSVRGHQSAALHVFV